VLDTPISPELLPADGEGNIAQKTEDLIGPYELHDFFLYNMLRNGFSPTKILKLACLAFEGVYEPPIILKWLETFYRRFFSQQFKRSCLPDGVKVGSVCLSPRGDWRMPSDASCELYLSELRLAGKGWTGERCSHGKKERLHVAAAVPAWPFNLKLNAK
jgi:NAD+ synthase (glutamine-hydrolysing)